MMRDFSLLIGRELRLALRHGMDNVVVLAFFVIAVTLFPFGIGPDPNTLARIAPGVLWVAALLAVLLSLERMFQADYDDGTLELLILSPPPLVLIVLAKVAAHWLVTGLPLVVMAPILGVTLQLETEAYGVMVLALLIGTPTLSLVGSMGAALVLGSRRGGVLIALLILPLYIPILIFGVGAIDAAINSLAVKPHLLLLGAMFTGALALCPWATSAALRLAAE